MKLDRSIHNINNLYDIKIEEVFKSKVSAVKDIIMNDYDQLSSFIVDTRSKADPAQLKELFILALDDFEFVKNTPNLMFSLPDLDTFDFTDLELIEQILEGTVGEYVEVPHEALSILGIVLNLIPINVLAEPQDRVYIMEANDELKARARRLLDYPLVIFPFSDTPSQYGLVFGGADTYVEENIDSWIDTAIKEANNKVSQTYKRI